MTDVTSLVAAARGELNRSLAETVNHNLRTPLTTMLGHAELLIDQQDDFPPEPSFARGPVAGGTTPQRGGDLDL